MATASPDPRFPASVAPFRATPTERRRRRRRQAAVGVGLAVWSLSVAGHMLAAIDALANRTE